MLPRRRAGDTLKTAIGCSRLRRALHRASISPMLAVQQLSNDAGRPSWRRAGRPKGSAATLRLPTTSVVDDHPLCRAPTAATAVQHPLTRADAHSRTADAGQVAWHCFLTTSVCHHTAKRSTCGGTTGPVVVQYGCICQCQCVLGSNGGIFVFLISSVFDKKASSSHECRQQSSAIHSAVRCRKMTGLFS